MGAETILFLVQQFRCGIEDYSLRGSSVRRHQLRMWYLKDSLTDWCRRRGWSDTNTRTGSQLGCVHAVVQCNAFSAKTHHGQLHNDFERLMREHVMCSREQLLATVLWGAVLNILLLNTPVLTNLWRPNHDFIDGPKQFAICGCNLLMWVELVSVGNMLAQL